VLYCALLRYGVGEDVLGESVRKIADVRELQESPPPLPGSSERQDSVGRVLHDPRREEIDPHVDRTSSWRSTRASAWSSRHDEVGVGGSEKPQGNLRFVLYAWQGGLLCVGRAPGAIEDSFVGRSDGAGITVG
jgi:hypothetical protein